VSVRHAAPPSADLLARLCALLGPHAVMREEAERYAYATDLLGAGSLPLAIARPSTVEELSAVVAMVTGANHAIVPRGGGLTYVGGYVPTHERSVVLDLSGLDRIVEINPEDMYVTVEAGVTWKAVHEALAPHGLRLPFFGTFSGRGATVGGGLSNGALFFGTARYGSAADIALGMGVVLADGRLLRTGQGSVLNAAKPFFRNYGPDLTGLFTHDNGALGVKAFATLRVIRAPEHTGFLSFTFGSDVDAVASLSEIGRAELAEEAYVMDPTKTADALGAPSRIRNDIRVLRRVIAQERSPFRGLASGLRLVAAGRRIARPGSWSLHVVCASRSRAGLAEDVRQARAVARQHGGLEIADSMPRAARATLFPPLDGVLGPRGERWVALNAKVAHSDALALVRAANALLAASRSNMDRLGVRVGYLLTVMSNHVFSYEPVFTWHDRWLPVHAIYAGGERRAAESTSNPEATALVMEVRQRLVELFREHGAASSQIGRTYPYLEALRPETREWVQALKRHADPAGLMNPGVLGLE
jgi:FAD/FMN-containing dehydrogenase